jgi:hypothetical protein
MLLHEGEHDDGQGNVHWLKRPPVAVFVEPKDAPVKRAAWLSLKKLMPTLPENCVPVVSGRTDSFAVKILSKLIIKDSQRCRLSHASSLVSPSVKGTP